MKNEDRYHYTECGLPDIWLKNGFTREETPFGTTVSINDIDGLHLAIGERLTKGSTDLSGAEMRFLRHELDLSQSALSKLLGIEEQAVARWEKGKSSASGPAQRLLRALYLSMVNDEANISKLLEKLSNVDTDMDEDPVEFELSSDAWSVKSAA